MTKVYFYTKKYLYFYTYKAIDIKTTWKNILLKKQMIKEFLRIL